MFPDGVNTKGASYPSRSLGGSPTGTLPSAGLSSTHGRQLSCSVYPYDASEG